jgi:hypothetical protein
MPEPEYESLSTAELQEVMKTLTEDRAAVEEEYKRRQKIVGEILFRREEEARLARIASAEGSGLPEPQVIDLNGEA